MAFGYAVLDPPIELPSEAFENPFGLDHLATLGALSLRSPSGFRSPCACSVAVTPARSSFSMFRSRSCAARLLPDAPPQMPQPG